MDPELDREIAEHVLRMHRYRNPGEQEGDGEKMAAAIASSATISDSRRRANKYFTCAIILRSTRHCFLICDYYFL